MGEIESYIGMGSSSVKLDEEFRDGLRYVDLLEDKKTLSPIESADRSIIC